jgi:methionyl-tRNA formyltransferase
MRVVFCGTPEFSVPSLKALIEESRKDSSFIESLPAVITQPDRPSGRGRKLKAPPVKLLAEENQVPVYQFKSLNKEGLSLLQELKPDLLVVVAFGQILSSKVLNHPPLGCVNVHSSLLPYLRGAAPIQWSILKGFEETGVTTMKLVKEMDAGPVYLQRTTPIYESDDAQTLHDRLSDLGAKLLLETLKGIHEKTLEAKEQLHDRATFAPPLTKDQGQVNWDDASSRVFNQIRGLYPWPGAYTFLKSKRVKLLKAHLFDKSQVNPDILKDLKPAPGRFFLLKKKHLLVFCGDDALIELEKVQPEGGKAVDGASFFRGFDLKKEKPVFDKGIHHDK